MKGLPRQATDTDGRLEIRQASIDDSGQYVCSALGTAAGAQADTVTLIVDDSCMILDCLVNSIQTTAVTADIQRGPKNWHHFL